MSRTLCQDVWINADTARRPMRKSPLIKIFIRQVRDQSGAAFQRLTHTGAASLAVEEGDYSGLGLIPSDRAANYSCDYKRSRNGRLIK